MGPKDRKLRYQSAALCLVLAFLCNLPPALLLMQDGLHSIASYKDFVIGSPYLSETLRSGFNKRLELNVVLLFLFCDLLVLPLLLWQREKILRFCKALLYTLFSLLHTLCRKISEFFRSPIFTPGDGRFAVLLIGLAYLVFLAASGSRSGQGVALYPVLVTYLALIFLLRERPELFFHVCMGGIGCYFSLMGVLVALHPTPELFNQARLYGIPLVCVVALCGALRLRRRADFDVARAVAVAWAAAPCLLFATMRTTYLYAGEPVELFPSWVSGRFLSAVIVAILFGNLITLLRGKYTSVVPTAALCIAVYLTWSPPAPYIQSDWSHYLFHLGEITTPLQQWLEFGKLPFRDYHPVHGLCDYYFFALSHLFFDGTYSSCNAGIKIGICLQSALQIFVFSKVYPNKYASIIFAIFLPALWGPQRWLAVGLCLPLTFLFFQRHNGIWFFLWSCFSGLFCLLWNVPQGAAYCAALIPLMATKCLRERPWSQPTRAQIVAGLGFCLIVLALFPVLKDLLLNTLVTTQLSPEAHGNSIIQGILKQPWYLTLNALLFIPFLVFLYIKAFLSHRPAWEEILMPVSLTFFCLICANYVFLRYDNGMRVISQSFYIIISSIPFICYSRPLFRFMGYTFLALTLLLNVPFRLPLPYQRMYVQKTVVCSDDFILPSDTSLSRIGNLGKRFIQPRLLRLLEDIRTYLDKNGNNFAIFDNSLAFYCIFNAENHLKFQTAFNTEGMYKQKDSLERIRDKDVDIVILPLRESYLYYLQTILFDWNFYPDLILDNNYLILKRNTQGNVLKTPATTEILQSRRVERLEHLPQVWDPACASLTEPVPISCELTLENCVRTEKGGFVSQKGGTVEMVIHFKEPVTARDFQFLLLSAQTGGRNHQVLVSSPDIAEGKNGYSFWLGKRAAAVPLFMNYAWLFSPSLREVRIEIKDIHPRKDFNLDIAFRRFLPE